MFLSAITTKIVSFLCCAFIFISGGFEVNGFGTKRDNYDTTRIMSFNLRCTGSGDESRAARAPYAAELINEYAPDSFGVQEANLAWIVQLCSRLPDYTYVGAGRFDGMLAGELSAVFYNKNVLKLVDSGTFWLSSTPEKPSRGWDAQLRRVCTWAVLENKETGEQYAHLNTHFDHIGFIARLKSAELIKQKAAEFDIPVVVTGDFNFKEGSYVYNKMTDSLLSDSKFLAEDSMDSITYHDYDPSSPLSKIIDFIFVNEKADPVTYRVITDKPDGYFVSDHYPIYADLILK